MLDRARLIGDAEYRNEARFRCQTDHFFLGRMLGYDRFVERIHRPVADLYVAKKPGLPLDQQDTIKNRLHLDPRLTYKTTFGIVDTVQWITIDADVTIANLTATQPLSQALTDTTVERAFYQPKGKEPTLFQLCFPEHVVQKFNTGEYNSPARNFPQPDKTITSTSVTSGQTGFHPWILNPDDAVDTENSGITATDKVRRGVISRYNTNRNTLQRGGYVHMRGTRYHPFELWGETLEKMDPAEWKVLIRGSLRTLNGQRLQEGEFPREEEVELLFPEIQTYAELRSKFTTDYVTFMCFPAQAKVLMADWTEKSISELRVGDEIVGFKKSGPWSVQLTRETVLKTFSRRAEVAKVVTDTGRTILTTLDHRFLRPLNGHGLKYGPLKVGTKMVSVYTPRPRPTTYQQRSLDWLGGLLDGEGSINKTSCQIHQKELINPEVCAKINEVLEVLQIRSSRGFTNTVDNYRLGGGRSLKIYLLQYATMAKRKRVIDSLWESCQIAETTGRGGGGHYPVVKTMDSIGADTVYDIQSSSENFICDGFAVHNCQQMNDPQGGSMAKFPAELFEQALVQPDKVPQFGEIFIFWRFPYGGKEFMAKYAEGAAARIVNGHLYIIDAWQGAYTPTGLAEKVVKECHLHQCGQVTVEDCPGARYLEAHIKNESYRKNISIRLNWIPFEEGDGDRFSRIEQLEPMLRSGRLSISVATGKAAELRRQFVHFGLISENGIIDAISRLAIKIPVSLLRTEIDAEEMEAQRRRRMNLEASMVYGAAGQQALEEQRLREQASMMAPRNSYGLPDVLGGLDG